MGYPVNTLGPLMVQRGHPSAYHCARMAPIQRNSFHTTQRREASTIQPGISTGPPALKTAFQQAACLASNSSPGRRRSREVCTLRLVPTEFLCYCSSVVCGHSRMFPFFFLCKTTHRCAFISPASRISTTSLRVTRSGLSEHNPIPCCGALDMLKCGELQQLLAATRHVIFKQSSFHYRHTVCFCRALLMFEGAYNATAQ